MRIEQLLYLIDVAQTNSINRSSDRLHLTHQSLNTAIRNLEKELNTTIFERSAKGVTLTENGKQIYVLAQEILNAYQKMKKISEEHCCSPLRGTLFILSAPFMNLSVSNIVSKEFNRLYPKVNLIMKSKESIDILAELEQNNADLYFLMTFQADDFEKTYNNKTYICQKIVESKLSLIVQKDHPLAKSKSLSMSTILKYPLALYQSTNNTQNIIMDIMPKNMNPRINLLTDDIVSFSEALLSGHSCALLPKLAMRMNNILNQNEQLTTVPIKNIPPVNFEYIIHRDTYKKKREIIDAFLMLMQKYM